MAMPWEPCELLLGVNTLSDGAILMCCTEYDAQNLLEKRNCQPASEKTLFDGCELVVTSTDEAFAWCCDNDIDSKLEKLILGD